ncbi:MAG: Type 1 glutamine amidotransferase-like domain-containing protein [Muribaculaceae bacterium]
MIYFLTSSPSVSMDGAINPANDFLSNLLAEVKKPSRCVFVTTHPDDAPWSEHCSECMHKALMDAGFVFDRYTLLDRRNAGKVKQIIADSDFVILGGGHVPTQNAFLADLNMAALLKHYNGVVMGISAGSMNCARIVYALPEEEGEATDPRYKRYLPGLGITEVQILPHYYLYKNAPDDGKHAYNDIAKPDSRHGHRFYAFPDGTYLLGKNGTEQIHGEFFVVENGVMRKVGENGQIIQLPFI